MIHEAAKPVSTWDALQELGFKQDPTVLSEQEAGLSYDFGGFQLTAGRMMNLQMQEALNFGALVSSARSMTSIEFEMPLQIESVEQCAAWIAWCLQQQLPPNTKVFPHSALLFLARGLQQQSTLPWVRQQAAYAARPHCRVERSWMRQAFKALAGHVSKDAPEDSISIRFDGAVLSFHGQDWTIPVPACGKAWPKPYVIRVGEFNSFPARLMQTEISVAIWEDKLTIGNRLYRGISMAEPTASPKQNPLFEHQS